MSIKSIKIKNLLSFDELIIDNFEDINCIVGKNNTGKSNLLKLIKFFYNKLDGKRELPPQLYSNYSAFGTITIMYSISDRIKIHLAKQDKKYFANISNYELTLKIHSNDSIEWSTKNKDILKTIKYLYPFFDIEARQIDLHNWDKLWDIISSLKSFNLQNLEENLFYKEKKENEGFDNFINLINSSLDTKKYTYGNKLLAFIKARIKGDKFSIGEDDLTTQSDGTNAHKFIESSLKLLLVLTKREYITPIIYIDEPEIGLHPKKNEELIESIYDTYIKEKRSKGEDYPTVIFATHSPNIVKQVIKLFDTKQQILHFSKKEKEPTKVQRMNSQYEDIRFLNIFSDNEARLFFSNFILFVEGETELEIFRNKQLAKQFRHLKYIDVYATNNVIFKYINPSYSNTSIPYLSIYDLDKIFDIDLKNKKIVSNRGGVINFNQLEKEYSKSYPSYQNKFKQKYSKRNLTPWYPIKEYSTSKNIKKYFDILSISKLNIHNNLYINSIIHKNNEYNYYSLVDFANQHIFNTKNIFFNHTTIEEVLINQENIAIFKKWLEKEYIEQIYINNNDKNENDGKTLKTIKNMINKYPQKLGLTKVFNILYTSDKEKHYIYKIPTLEYEFTEKIKKRYFQYIIKCIERLFKTDREVLTLFLLMFNGKTETLISRENKNYTTYIDEDYIALIKKIRTEWFKNLDYLFSKTSGWATSFLNFAIDEIENNRGEKEFKDEFKKYFGELYDIISIIEKKL